MTDWIHPRFIAYNCPYCEDTRHPNCYCREIKPLITTADIVTVIAHEMHHIELDKKKSPGPKSEA